MAKETKEKPRKGVSDMLGDIPPIHWGLDNEKEDKTLLVDKGMDIQSPSINWGLGNNPDTKRPMPNKKKKKKSK